MIDKRSKFPRRISQLTLINVSFSRSRTNLCITSSINVYMRIHYVRTAERGRIYFEMDQDLSLRDNQINTFGWNKFSWNCIGDI